MDKADVARKAAAAKQPPAMPGDKGQVPETTNDVAAMTEEEFDALPESKKVELRGDAV